MNIANVIKRQTIQKTIDLLFC